MIWVLLLVGLGLAGLPWFAALGLTLVAHSFHAGLDPLLIMLEFSRIAETQELLAIPLLLWGLGLVQAQIHGSRRISVDLIHGQTLWAWSGKWLLQRSKAGAGTATPADIAALLFAASPPLVVIWLVFQAVSPGHAPKLQHLLLAALIPACFAAIVAMLRWPGSGDQKIRPDASRWPSLVLLLPLAGVYSGQLRLLEAAAAALAMVLLYALARGTVSTKVALTLMLDSLKEFGRLALVLGLGLAWFALVFDQGMDRQWLSTLATNLPWPQLAVILIGIWLSAIWMLGAWLLRPLPALIVGAPWLFPASVQSGLAGPVLALITLLSLYAGYQLRAKQGGGGQGQLSD